MELTPNTVLKKEMTLDRYKDAKANASLIPWLDIKIEQTFYSTCRSHILPLTSKSNHPLYFRNKHSLGLVTFWGSLLSIEVSLLPGALFLRNKCQNS